jgi:hypothetical protein
MAKIGALGTREFDEEKSKLFSKKIADYAAYFEKLRSGQNPVPPPGVQITVSMNGKVLKRWLT